MAPERVLVVVAALLGLAASPSARAEIDRASLIGLAPSVLKIEAVDAEGRFQLGSGVIVAEGKVVTNCHVTRRAQRIQVVKGGVRWGSSLQAADMRHDLCLLQVPRLEGAPVSIARASSLRMGQSVLAIGYTGGVGLQLSEGDIVALHRWSGSQIVQSTNWFSSGASGGGLFDAQGALVGVLTFRLRGGAAHYFAAPADWVLPLLDDDASLRRIGPLTGESFWEGPIENQPLFLQAAALEQRAQWPALAQLAERWGLEDASDPEPAYLLGVARDGQQQTEAAIAAFRRSLDLDPAYGRSWASLARIYQRQGQAAEARRALARLTPLDPHLAREVAAELEKP